MLQAERKPGSLAALDGCVDENYGMLQQGTSASFACKLRSDEYAVHSIQKNHTAEGIQLFPITVTGNDTGAFNISTISARRGLVAVNVPDAFIAQLSPLCIAVSLHSVWRDVGGIDQTQIQLTTESWIETNATQQKHTAEPTACRYDSGSVPRVHTRQGCGRRNRRRPTSLITSGLQVGNFGVVVLGSLPLLWAQQEHLQVVIAYD